MGPGVEPLLTSSVTYSIGNLRMTQVHSPELATILARPARPVAPTVENGVQVAAATLCHASADVIMSTTVVVDIGLDDLDALRSLVNDIANVSTLDAAIHPHIGWCAVRFTR